MPSIAIGPRTADHMLAGHPEVMIADDQATSGQRHSLPGRRPIVTVATTHSTLSP
jgi:hypothetical protein